MIEGAKSSWCNRVHNSALTMAALDNRGDNCPIGVWGELARLILLDVLDGWRISGTASFFCRSILACAVV